jgi:hypothetical protein
MLLHRLLTSNLLPLVSDFIHLKQINNRHLRGVINQTHPNLPKIGAVKAKIIEKNKHIKRLK